MSAIVVITTAGTEEEANSLARELVGRRHAACVNVLPVHKSVYRWQGKLCEESEFLLVIKSIKDEYRAIEATIQELHSYELPEVLAIPIQHADERFLGWIAECVDKSPIENDGYDDDLENGDPPA